MSDEHGNFKVTDRRLFNPDGSPRDLPAEEKTEQAATILGETPSGGTFEPQTSKSESRENHGSDIDHDRFAETDLADADDPASFVNFVMSIASNAASSLGMIEHPVTNQREVDLQLGKHWIDVLGMLQQKTRGNLVSQEQQILEGLLADLRMQYVSLSNSSSAKGAHTFTGRDITGGR